MQFWSVTTTEHRIDAHLFAKEEKLLSNIQTTLTESLKPFTLKVLKGNINLTLLPVMNWKMKGTLNNRLC